jgi:hypothetical protein
VRGILVEVEAGGAEGKIHVEDQHVLAKVLTDGPGDVMSDGRTARAALGGNERDGSPDRRGVLAGEEIADGRNDIWRGGWQDDIFRDAGADQLAIEQHVIDVAENDQPWGGWSRR